MISYGQAIVLGLLQGVSELFPISSLGHSVILPRIFGWDIHQNDPFFLTFLIATHLATALVLLGFFWRDWVRIVRGLGRSLAQREIAADDVDAKLAWLLVFRPALRSPAIKTSLLVFAESRRLADLVGADPRRRCDDRKRLVGATCTRSQPRRKCRVLQRDLRCVERRRW